MKIIVGSYMARYPLGGMMSWVMQFLVGFQRLGHQVYFVEKALYQNACYDPRNNSTGDDPSYGLMILNALLKTHGLERRWCFVDCLGQYYGMDKAAIETVFQEADLYIDMGVHGAWNDESRLGNAITVLVDGEPGFTQIKMELKRERGENIPEYDQYFTAGVNIFRGTSLVPDTGIKWKPLQHPVVSDSFQVVNPPAGAPFTTIMNWQSHAAIVYKGRGYGQKDKEFGKFMDLPRRVSVPMEIAVAGHSVPYDSLRTSQWRTKRAQEVTISLDSFKDYINRSLGEFSVCKEVFIVNRTGWFSDRSAAYLASGRPVIQQNTGFDEYLPCGEGLFAVDSVEAAVDAIEQITADYNKHSQAARRIAAEHLDTQVVLKRFIRDLEL